MDPIRVVVHFRDNRLIKGYTKKESPTPPAAPTTANATPPWKRPG